MIFRPRTSRYSSGELPDVEALDPLAMPLAAEHARPAARACSASASSIVRTGWISAAPCARAVIIEEVARRTSKTTQVVAERSRCGKQGDLGGIESDVDVHAGGNGSRISARSAKPFYFTFLAGFGTACEASLPRPGLARVVKEILLRVAAVFAEIGRRRIPAAGGRSPCASAGNRAAASTRSIQTSIGKARSRSKPKSSAQFATFSPTPGKRHSSAQRFRRRAARRSLRDPPRHWRSCARRRADSSRDSRGCRRADPPPPARASARASDRRRRRGRSTPAARRSARRSVCEICAMCATCFIEEVMNVATHSQAGCRTIRSPRQKSQRRLHRRIARERCA